MRPTQIHELLCRINNQYIIDTVHLANHLPNPRTYPQPALLSAMISLVECHSKAPCALESKLMRAIPPCPVVSVEAKFSSKSVFDDTQRVDVGLERSWLTASRPLWRHHHVTMHSAVTMMHLCVKYSVYTLYEQVQPVFVHVGTMHHDASTRQTLSTTHHEAAR